MMRNVVLGVLTLQKPELQEDAAGRGTCRVTEEA